jgi:hypothetical protein
MDGVAENNKKHSWLYWLANLVENIPTIVKKPDRLAWFYYFVEHSFIQAKEYLQKKSPKFFNLLKRLFGSGQFLQKSMRNMSSAVDSNWQIPQDEVGANMLDSMPGSQDNEQQELLIVQQIQNNYHPKRYSGRVTVFSARLRESPHLFFESADRALGWRGLVQGGVDIHTFKGNHHSLYEPPYVTALAATLKKILQKLDAGE